MEVRVRYAPSPTGLQHIGGVRTALFNYFFARSEGGTFILRIEDTDRERYNDDALQDLYDTLDWLGIEWDEGPEKGGPYGPYVQSERFGLYREYADKLLESGHAYRCFCTAERLEKLREEQKKEKKSLGYDRHCRNLSKEEIEEKLAAGEPHVIRFKVPLEGKTSFEDVLLGRVTRKNKDISPDPILLKTDGFPTYHLANVVDDHFMKISHILRAQEWIPSGALHVLLYGAFGWEPPVYCHLPMVMGKDGQKLSKRHGSTSVVEFRSKGYLPEAIINYVSMVGWSYDDKREFFTREELEKLFSLEKINKAPGVFDYKKLEWFNGQYIRKKSMKELTDLVIPFLKKDGIVSDPLTDDEAEIVEAMMPLMAERLHLLSDITKLSAFLFRDITGYETASLIPKKMDAARTLEVLKETLSVMDDILKADEEQAEVIFRNMAEKLDVKLGSVLMPLRVAVTGSTVSPPIIGSVKLLGAEKTKERVRKAIEKLEREVNNG